MANQPNIEQMRCPAAEPLFADYIDGTLDEATRLQVERHIASCVECADEVKHIQAGKDWLHLLHDEDLATAAPAGLAEKVLARTQGGGMAGAVATPAAAGRAPWRQVNLAAVRGSMQRTGLFEPRLIMTAAMAFFSVSITMNILGIRLSDLQPQNLRHTVLRTYSDTSAHVTRYYENIRVVYQLESRVRELRRAAEASDAQRLQQQQQQQNRKSPQNSTPPQSNRSHSSLNDGVAGRGNHSGKAEAAPAPVILGDALEADLATRPANEWLKSMAAERSMA